MWRMSFAFCVAFGARSASRQSGGSQQGGSLQDSFDPFGFLNRNAALQNLTTRPPTTP